MFKILKIILSILGILISCSFVGLMLFIIYKVILIVNKVL